MTNYRRYRLKGGCYFFTVALAERQSRLLTENIQGLRTGLCKVKKAHPVTMEAVVILPDHLHWIWTLPEDDDDFSTHWRQIKAAYSRQLPTTERRSKRRVQKVERGYLATAPPGRLPNGRKASKFVPDEIVAAAVLGACETGCGGLPVR